jgi:serine/threonine protein kinase
MAPELLLHGRASKASDVYAFGILLWELATGLRAFQGKRPTHARIDHLSPALVMRLHVFHLALIAFPVVWLLS